MKKLEIQMMYINMIYSEKKKCSWAEQTVFESLIARQRMQVFHTSAASEIYIGTQKRLVIKSYGGNHCTMCVWES